MSIKYKHAIDPGGGGGGTPPKLGYGAQHKLKIWSLRDLTTSEKGALKDLKRVFGKFEIGGLKIYKSRYRRKSLSVGIKLKDLV